jgi:hypothetical protein
VCVGMWARQEGGESELRRNEARESRAWELAGRTFSRGREKEMAGWL